MDDVLERIEIEALSDFWQAAPPATRAALGLDVDEIGDATCFRCRELQPTLMFRRAVGLGLRRPASPEAAGLPRSRRGNCSIHSVREAFGCDARRPGRPAHQIST